MAQDANSIKQLYDEGMAEVFSIVGSMDSTAKQRKVARETAKELTAMLVENTLETINGRTALLTGLIKELNRVIAAVETAPPYADALENFTKITARAQKLVANVKNLT